MRFAKVLACLVLSAPVAAQTAGTQSLVAPSGWQWRLDAPGRIADRTNSTATDSTFRFEEMAPGWHVTMGPGGFLYDPANMASGRFAVQAEMILFPGTTNDEFGLFIGGRDNGTGGEAVSWFVLRRDGQAGAFTFSGGQMRPISDWAPREGIKPLAADGTVRTVIRVLAEPDSVRYFVDGNRVGAWPRELLPADGVYGFRIGRGTNMHITSLDFTRRHAPFPVRR